MLPHFPVGKAVLFYAVLLGIAVLWREWADGVLPWRPAGAARPGPPAGAQILLGLAAGAVLLGVSRAYVACLPAGQRLARELAGLLGPLSNGAVLLLAAASGLAEEAFFRGALQPRVGWLVASLLFAAAHFVPRRGLRSWSVFALLAGLLFGGLFERAGGLLAPTVGHVLVNAANLRWLARYSSSSRRSSRTRSR